MTCNLKDLADNRDALLLAEVAAWLHMIGKYHEKFVNGTTGMDIKIPAELDVLLKDDWPSKFWDKLPVAERRPKGLGICDLIQYHRNRKYVEKYQSGFLKLFIDAHGRASVTEKGVLKKESYGKHNNHVYLSTAFGYEKMPIEVTLLKKRKIKLYRFLDDQLNNLKSSLDVNAPWDLDKWAAWRQQFIDRLQEDFSTSVGDTRLPINDVSLWDQTAATVAFFKTELAEVILKGWKDPSDESNRFKYRIICVSFDAKAFIAQSPRIGDMLARIQIIKRGFDAVKNFIEVDYPLGLEIYRDTDRIAFLAPDVDNLLEIQNGSGKTIRQLIEERFNNIVKGEVDAEISLSKSGSRNVFFIGSEVSKSLKALSPKLYFLKESWNIPADKCRICQIRPCGYGAELIDEYKDGVRYYTQKAHERKMCCICMNRLQGRAKDWADNLNTTIWIDEVADINGRIALIVGRFDLKQWLNGELISTFRNPRNNCGVEFSEIKQELAGNQNQELENLSNYKKIGEPHAGTIQGLYNLLIHDEDLGEDAYSSIPKADKLALAVWRKPPSFARTYRIWGTTNAFWDTVVQDMQKTVVGPRLEVLGELNPKDPGLYHAYALCLGSTNLGVVWDANKKRFIITDNLEYLEQPTKLGESVEGLLKAHIGEEVEIEEPTGYGSQNTFWGTIRIEAVNQIPDSTYAPVIPILAEPHTFMAIVPASSALEVAGTIKKKYEKEMGKVRNRLPLTLGLVFAKSHTPLAALMDAGRRMLSVSNREAEWVLEDAPRSDRGTSCILNFTNGNTWHIPAKMGDNRTDDVWYPYFYVNGVPEGRSTAFKGPEGWLVHVKELKKGDNVRITPSRFDFEFLDTASRRFEVSYENGKRRDPLKSGRPYVLEELTYFEKCWNTLFEGLARSQIKKVIGLIETKRDEWLIEEGEDVFKKVAHDVLHNANWKSGTPIEKINDLEKAAVSGELKDIVELYMYILKVREGEEKQQEVFE